MKLKRKNGKGLGGEAPRRKGRWQRDLSPSPTGGLASQLAALAFGMFLVGVVVGYGWALDRQVRGGILRQRVEASRRPDWAPLRSLPAYVPAAFVAVVEPEQLREGALRPPENGTTLARELVRQVHQIPSSLPGTAEELAMGPVLERHLSRSALTELFLNRALLGRSHGAPVYGIWHASHEYFGKQPRQLTLSEAATLAGLLLPPRITDPQLRIGAVGSRRNEVLRVMHTGELITEQQYREALAEPLGFQPGLEQMPMSRPADWVAPPEAIRLPPNLRPTPPDSAEQRAAG